jgi:hypothetical protein
MYANVLGMFPVWCADCYYQYTSLVVRPIPDPKQAHPDAGEMFLCRRNGKLVEYSRFKNCF